MDLSEAKGVLSNLGLSDWEIESYLILVRYGPKTAVELSRLSKVPRSKTYEVTTRLRRKGLVIKVPPMPAKGVTQKFVANNPEEVFPAKLGEIESLSKYLSEAYKSPLKPRYPSVVFYTTKDTARKFLLRTVKDSRFAYFYISNSGLKHVLGYSFEQSLENIKKRKLLVADTRELRNLFGIFNDVKFIKDSKGINYIITPESLVFDLWESQHLILEVKSKEAVKTFLRQYSKLTKDD